MKKILLVLVVLAVLFLGGCTQKKYIIHFVDYQNNLIIERVLAENEKIIAPQAPEREGYDFIGWDKEFDRASEDMVIKAMYQPKQFTVTFIGLDGEVVKEENVLYGLNATAPVLPYPEGYYRWDRDFKDVKSNLTVRAITDYKIQYFDGNTELFFNPSSYQKNERITLPVPTKDGYEFIGWFLSDLSLYKIEEIDESFYGDLKLYSRWLKLEQDLLEAPVGGIEFAGIKKVQHSSGVGYVYQPIFPSGTRSTSVSSYYWESSNTKVATISAYSSISVVSPGYAIIKGTLNTDPNYVLYLVIKTTVDGVFASSIEEANQPQYVYATFRFEDGSSVRKVVNKGGHVIPPTPAEKAGYIFVGWEGENGETIYNIDQDTTFYPNYVEGNTEKSYVGKTVSVLGDSISTYLGYIPEGFAPFYPYPTADIGDVYQTWWMQFINHFGMKLLVNNSWGGSTVAGTGTSSAQTMARLNYLKVGYTVPDVILIFMGANDAASPYINANDFDEAYGKMLANIKQIAPDAEIILCTLPALKLYTEENQAAFNDVIKKYATAHGCTLIDLDSAFTRSNVSNYLVDSAHPNFTGMTRIAEVAIESLKEKL